MRNFGAYLKEDMEIARHKVAVGDVRDFTRRVKRVGQDIDEIERRRMEMDSPKDTRKADKRLESLKYTQSVLEKSLEGYRKRLDEIENTPGGQLHRQMMDDDQKASPSA